MKRRRRKKKIRKRLLKSKGKPRKVTPKVRNRRRRKWLRAPSAACPDCAAPANTGIRTRPAWNPRAMSCPIQTKPTHRAKTRTRSRSAKSSARWSRRRNLSQSQRKLISRNLR
uniref:(northern house mosquito) hypothetical protein n=1 Tax=Culex pipiens TaxID=7175 RepID=A0A8D8JSQ8_CULPI